MDLGPGYADSLVAFFFFLAVHSCCKHPVPPNLKDGLRSGDCTCSWSKLKSLSCSWNYLETMHTVCHREFCCWKHPFDKSLHCGLKGMHLHKQRFWVNCGVQTVLSWYTERLSVCQENIGHRNPPAAACTVDTRGLFHQTGLES